MPSGQSVAVFGWHSRQSFTPDEAAIAAASERLKGYPGFHAIHGNFHDVKTLLPEGVTADGGLLDLGYFLVGLQIYLRKVVQNGMYLFIRRYGLQKSRYAFRSLLHDR